VQGGAAPAGVLRSGPRLLAPPLASLRGYGFDSIKVDKSLISNIGRDPLAPGMAHAAIHGIGKLGLVSVAEGIDDPQVPVMLQTMGAPAAGFGVCAGHAG